MELHFGRPRPEYYDFEFERQIIERYGPRIPNKVFDAHFHLSPDEIANVSPENMFDTWKEYTNAYLGGDKIRGGLMMGNPKLFKTKEALDEDREFACSTAEAHDGFVSGLVVRPEDDPKDAEAWINRYPKLAVLKPYRNYAIAEDTYEADIITYAPEWIWELADHYGKCIVLHLSHYRDGLSAKDNGDQLRYLCKKYPNVKVNLAHCSMGHNPEKLKWGLHYLEGLDNVYTDMGGIGEALSMIYMIKTLGPKRVMFASDGYKFAFDNATRCFAVGGSFLGHIYSWTDLKLPPDYKFTPVTPFLENICAYFAAGDVCELTDSQWEDLFYNNAHDMYFSCTKK